jgi:hypothetical protein
VQPHHLIYRKAGLFGHPGQVGPVVADGQLELLASWRIGQRLQVLTYPAFDPRPRDPVGVVLEVELHITRHHVGHTRQRLGQQGPCQGQHLGVGFQVELFGERQVEAG